MNASKKPEMIPGIIKGNRIRVNALDFEAYKSNPLRHVRKLPQSPAYELVSADKRMEYKTPHEQLGLLNPVPHSLSDEPPLKRAQ